MKRKDLQVGMKVAIVKSDFHADYPSEALVVATEPYECVAGWRVSHVGRTRLVERGNGVAVAVPQRQWAHAGGGIFWSPEVVQLGHLKPWEEAVATKRARREAWEAKQTREATLRERQTEAATELKALAEELGLRGWSEHERDVNVLRVRALVAALQERQAGGAA